VLGFEPDVWSSSRTGCGRHRGITEPKRLGRARAAWVMRCCCRRSGGRPQYTGMPSAFADVILARDEERVSLAYVKTMTRWRSEDILRFLGARGLCRAGLETRPVPTIPQWAAFEHCHATQSGGRPRFERLIATCDPDRQPAGARRSSCSYFLLARPGDCGAGDVCCAPARCHRLAAGDASPFAARWPSRDEASTAPGCGRRPCSDYLKRGRPRVARDELFPHGECSVPVHLRGSTVLEHRVSSTR